MQSFEKEIINGLIKGDENSFRDLFDFYYRPLCIFALKYLDTIEQAEDLVQDIFVHFWNNRSYENISTGIKAYLFSAVKNNALNHIRKNSKYRFEEIDNLVLETMENELSEDELTDLKKKLYNQVEQLPEKGREIFKAIVFQNMKYQEVAELFGITVNTVKTHYTRALSRLRNSLNILILVLLN